MQRAPSSSSSRTRSAPGGRSPSPTAFARAQTAPTARHRQDFCQQANCADGSGPLASPIVGADGTLYGTTALDSRAYSFAPQTSTYTVLHTFCTDTKCSDGIEPLTPDAAGHLFGTTAFGGTKHSGGTVFVLTP
ncbi:MAG TPA: choice-of-anchor tandem repeat GloVer-containing protein [Rhizomicrobium sp.]|jgi:hypothetical protein|nr:choice-of-anchor tandem repeat GloVer-containing protein [Rhizomicrobium sp.]